MKRSNIFLVGLVFLALLAAGTSLGERIFSHLSLYQRPNARNTTTYYCREGIVEVTYLDKKVRILLPDGRKFILPQAVAASGARYSDGKIEFWSKGANAFVLENGKIICSDGVAGTVRPIDRKTALFRDDGKNFSFQYPNQFRISGKGIGFSRDWRVGARDLGMVLAMVTIPKSYLPQTNFSGATFTIGQSSNPAAVKRCFEKPQGYGGRMEQVAIQGVPFTKFTLSEAGAGNVYETVSYRTKRGEACYGVEYTIHSTNIGMYPPEQAIQEFDKARISSVLEKMAGSFRFLR